MKITDFKPVVTAIKSRFDDRLEADLNFYESRYGYRSMRIRPVIERVGWVNAIEQTVSKNQESSSYRQLIKMGLAHLAWENFVLIHPELFSEKCIINARERMRWV